MTQSSNLLLKKESLGVQVITAISPQEPEESLAARVRRLSPAARRVVTFSYYRPLLTLMHGIADAGAIIISFLLAFTTWNYLAPLLPLDLYEVEAMSRYFPFLGVTLVTCLIGFKVNNLYEPQRSLMNVKEFELLLRTWLVACGVTLAILFMAEQLYFSRGVFTLTWAFLLIILLIERYAFFKFNNFLRGWGFVETTALIYGTGDMGRKLVQKFRQSPKLGYHVAGYIDDSQSKVGQKIDNLGVLGTFGELRKLIRLTGAQQLFIALPHVPSKVVTEIMQICRETHCRFQIVPSLYDIVLQRIKITELEGIPLISMKEPRYRRRTFIFKRIFDVVMSSLMLVALSPVMITLALIVRLSSPGPIIFKQKRVGKDGCEFDFFKFRSMYVDAPKYATTPQSGHDPRITPIGRFLRRSSLDELPQLFNVLLGDMSLVGPRPEMPFIVKGYNELQRQRLNVIPGITGLWQISPDRKLAIHENMDYDMYYIYNQSFLLDLVILTKTITSCIKGVGAY